jgi:hypothetical protein
MPIEYKLNLPKALFGQEFFHIQLIGLDLAYPKMILSLRDYQKP